MATGAAIVGTVLAAEGLRQGSVRGRRAERQAESAQEQQRAIVRRERNRRSQELATQKATATRSAARENIRRRRAAAGGRMSTIRTTARGAVPGNEPATGKTILGA